MNTARAFALKSSRNGRRGSAVVELAVAFAVSILGFAGAWQFAYTFYLYNNLQTAIRNGARYASLTEYDGSGGGSTFTRRVQNMVVYGNPSPPEGAAPAAPGLTPAHISVIAARDSAGVPSRVTVEISDFTLSSGLSGVFGGFRLRGKPSCTFDYVGRYSAL